jgi:hypothetical protein
MDQKNQSRQELGPGMGRVRVTGRIDKTAFLNAYLCFSVLQLACIN